MTDYLEKTDQFMRSLELETYRVGGSVRDELLGRRCKDADYMVRGMELMNLGSALHGAATAYHKKAKVSPLKLRDRRQAGWRVSARGLGCLEIMLPRTEISTGPGHRDFKIVVDSKLGIAEDAKRRDFTFNALYKAINQDGQIVDPTGRGLYDLQHKLISTTHETSFRDDPLRILRALRFVSVLGYDLGSETSKQMQTHAQAVDGLTPKGVSGTVYDELCKILMGENVVQALRLGRDAGVLAALLPELAPMIGFEQGSRYHDLTTDEHTFCALETAVHVGAPLRVRLALLFHDSGKPESAWRGEDGRLHYYENNELHTEDHEIVSERIWRKTANRLNIPKEMREDVAVLVRNHMVPIRPKVKGSAVRRDRVKFGDELLRDLYMHRMCDLSGKANKVSMNHIQHIAALEKERQSAEKAKIPASVGDLRISGKDLIDRGMNGREIGVKMREILDEVVCQPDELRLSREWQLGRIV